MNKILTTKENKGLFYNSALKTRSYSDGKKSNSFPPGDPSETGSLIPREVIKGRGLDPHWVTGLVDAEGSFIVFIKLNPNNSKNLVRQIQLSFEVSFHIKDIELLYKLKSFFGEAGTIFIPSTRKDARLKITGLNEIVNFIIPHFKQYPLHGMKKIDYDLWSECAELLQSKQHLQEKGLNRILSIKSVLNNGLSDKLKALFPSVIAIDRPVLDVANIPLNPNYVSGFTYFFFIYYNIWTKKLGDGCFTVNISSNTKQITAYYIIELHKREVPLLSSIQKFFRGVGSTNIALSRNTARFSISKKSDLISKVLPHFDAHKLEGNKLKNYLIFREIVLLLGSKAHLTQKGFDKIKLLKEGLNN